MPTMKGNPHSLIDTSPPPPPPPPPLKIVFILTNSADPEQMPPLGVFHLGLHCLSKYLFTGIQNEKKRVNNLYGKCSKISNTLKSRTPKIIAENNF